jgi:para-aminobenzoate synthetase/4-amino-4-deoxychorismate lyase
MGMREGTVILYSPEEQRWQEFSDPVEVVAAHRAGEVRESLRHVEDEVRRHGLSAAGFLAYEAAPAFDPAMRTRPAQELPLMWFGLYKGARTFSLPSDDSFPLESLDWQPTVTRQEYGDAVRDIRARIAAGLTYQVNYTYRLHSPFPGDPWRYFLSLAGNSRSGYPAYLDLGRWAVCSASPELFFQLRNGVFESRPMKGTAPRGGTLKEDDEQARWLRESEKNRAENLMIVDMIRNDVGRVAEIGSVAVPRLFDVERFPTVLQMTSTVTARVRASFCDIMSALFPCASITGAPKVSTMGIIAELEKTPRGVYCGSIGFLSPDGDGVRAQFNVAIRTVTVDRGAAQAEYGVGGGILWESDPEEEYRECEVKTKVLRQGSPSFDLLEAILWTPEGGWYLLERHMKRLAESALYFGVPLDLSALGERLAALAAALPPEGHKVRVALSLHGEASVTAQPLSAIARPPVQRVCLSRQPVRASDSTLFHKTSDRAEYNRELSAHPGFDEVIFWNEKGEVTESCTANVVAEIGGAKVTPPVSCGLLPGTFRAELLEQGSIVEQVFTKEQLLSAGTLWLINSVRRWMPARFAEE